MNSDNVFLLKIPLMNLSHYIFKQVIVLLQPLAEWLHRSLFKLRVINELSTALATGNSISQAVLSFHLKDNDIA